MYTYFPHSPNASARCSYEHTRAGKNDTVMKWRMGRYAVKITLKWWRQEGREGGKARAYPRGEKERGKFLLVVKWRQADLYGNGCSIKPLNSPKIAESEVSYTLPLSLTLFFRKESFLIPIKKRFVIFAEKNKLVRR